jgi:hypothetical protein
MDERRDPAPADRNRQDEGWTVPQPEILPRPTWWPAVFALGSILVLWGLITTLIITGVGAILFLASAAGWIRELRHEHRS